MSKKYSKKKRVNGGNVITRRSNHSRISRALPLKKSLNRLRSNQKRQLHPKVSTTTSKLAVSEKSSTKPSEEDDFMKTYILYSYSYSNSENNRKNIGINHPLLKDVNVNDYMNSIENIKREMEKSINDETSSLNLDMDSILPTPIINYDNNKHTKSDRNKRNKRSKRPHSVGGIGPDSPDQDDQDDANDEDEIQYDPLLPEAVDADLNVRLNLVRLVRLMNDAETCTAGTWKQRSDLFLRHMFIDRAYTKRGISLLLPRNRNPASNYVFNVRIPHKPELPSSDTVTLKNGPGLWFKLIAAKNQMIKNCSTADTLPCEERSGHSEKIIKENIQQFEGKYNRISGVEKRHIIYSTLLFILANSNDDPDGLLTNIVREFNMIEPRHVELRLEHVKFINDKISKKIKNSLPYSLFYTTARPENTRTTNRKVTIDLSKLTMITIPEIQGHIDGYFARTPGMSFIMTVLPADCMHLYKQLLDFMYKKIFGNGQIRTGFNLEVSSGDHPLLNSVDFKYLSGKLTVTKITNDPTNNLTSWFFLKNTEQIDCKRVGSNPERNVIVNENGNALFYTGPDTHVLTVKPKVMRGTQFIRGMLHRPQDMDLTQEAPLSRRIWYEKTRIRDPRDKLMGYLAELVYCPNDIVAQINDAYLSGDTPELDKLIYIGPFDNDPSFPVSSNNEPIYSRVHVWLKINRTDNTKTHELYFVSRGSKTGYDWVSADNDIQSGVLHSFRSSHVVNILKDVIVSLNASLDALDEIGASLSSWQRMCQRIQIFSIGHSLGGYLSLYLSFASLNNHIVNGISHTHISGTTTQSPTTFILNPYIIPIVFDPYVSSTPLMSAFSYLPYVRIHSCIDSSLELEVGQAGSIQNNSRVYHRYSFVPAVRTSGDLLRYNDAASGIFLDYIRAKYYNSEHIISMGQFRIFEYSNTYNLISDPAIYHDNLASIPLVNVPLPFLPSSVSRVATTATRFTHDMRLAHDMCQIIGLSLTYVVSNMMSKFTISTPYDAPCDLQNIQVARYSFPIPYNRHVSFQLTQAVSLGVRGRYRYNRLSRPVLQVNASENPGTDAYTIEYNAEHAITNLTPLRRDVLFETCGTNIRACFDEFIRSR
jgi:hypothetical protein